MSDLEELRRKFETWEREKCGAASYLVRGQFRDYHGAVTQDRWEMVQHFYQAGAAVSEQPVDDKFLANFGGVATHSWSETTIDNEGVAWVLRAEAEARLAVSEQQEGAEKK